MKNSPSIKSFLNLSKIIIVNFFIFCFLWLSLEIFMFLKNPLIKESNRITCNYDWILYNYCPDIIDIRINSKSDGGEVIEIHTNEIGQRVNPNNKKTNNIIENFFIGDSFIQSDEIAYENTFYGILSNEKSISAIGYSSWNLFQYKDVIKKIKKRDINYHIFMMPNDFSPLYERSVYGEILDSPLKIEDVNIPTGWNIELKKFYNLSLLKKFLNLFENTSSQDLKITPSIITGGFNEENSDNCLYLDMISDTQKNSLGYDYLVFSKTDNCWEELHLNAVNLAISEIDAIRKLVLSLDAEVFFYLVPPGWSFKSQNTNGRKKNEHYFFSDLMEITTIPLTNFIEKSLIDIKIINLENIFKEKILDCNNCENLYYLSDDGHWTKEAHRFLADYFKNKI